MSPHVFLFGKLPAHGDFVVRGGAPPLRDVWDAWISEGLQAAQRRLGDAFERAHEDSAPWRFIEGPGRFGSGWSIGVLSPSIDSIGRRFMVLVGVDDLDARPTADGDALTEDFEDLIRAALVNTWTADETFRRATAIATSFAWAAVEPDAGAASALWWTAGGEGYPAEQVIGQVCDVWTRIFQPTFEKGQ